MLGNIAVMQYNKYVRKIKTKKEMEMEKRISQQDLNELSTTGNIKDIKIVKIHFNLNFTGVEDEAMRSEIQEAHNKGMALVIKKISNQDKIREISLLNLECELNTTLKTTGGDADFRNKKIRMNYKLHKENPSEVVNTYLHELGHILNRILYPTHRRSHGWEWKNVMYLLESNSERCHKMDTSKVRRKRTRHVYTCSCENREYKLTAGQHKNNVTSLKWATVKPSLGGPRYSCKTCKSNLVFNGQTIKI